MTKWNGLGEPECSRLALACIPIRMAFGTHVYLVGTAATQREFRDVDVRVILSDDKFNELFGPARVRKPFYTLVNVGISAYLSNATGLPVDFQVFPRSEVKEEDLKKKRHNLMIVEENAYWSVDKQNEK